MAGEYILIVDDEELIRRQAEAALKRIGYRTATAANGKEALEIIKEAAPDLLLADIRMPEMDGLELLARARQYKPDLGGVLMTAYGTLDNLIKSMQLGVTGFLMKPFTGSELGQAVQEALVKSQASQETGRLRSMAPLVESLKLFKDATNLEGLSNSLVATLAAQSKVDYCAIFLQEQDAETQAEGTAPALKLVARYAGPAALAFTPRSFPVLRLAARAIDAGRSLVFRRSSEAESEKIGPGELIPGAIIAVPLMTGERALGTLLVCRADLQRAFSNEERELFETLAYQFALLVDNHRLREALVERDNHLRLIVGRFVTSQEEEKRRLAERILAEVLPPLTVSRQSVQAYLQKVRTPSAVDLIKTEERLHSLINQTKKLAQDLRPVNLEEFGLNAALRQYVREVAEAPGAKSQPTFRVEGAEVPRLPAPVEIALFRATQDALNNACQHAAGSEITVTARVKGPRNKPQLAEIEISDQGPGFDPRQPSRGRAQLGLAAMQERLLLAGAKCEIHSAPGQGTRVFFSYNIPDEG
jgi:signal transduction histidine kinase/CheY-like chemotaxis protein